MSNTHVNPETDPDNKPFEVGDRIALTGAEGRQWDGTPFTAVVTSIRWDTDMLIEGGFWFIEVKIDQTGEYDVLGWYECVCCTLWGEKIES